MNALTERITTAVLINSFNRLELFKQALGALDKWLPEDQRWRHQCVVVVYDAGSRDGTLEWLQAKQESGGYPIDVITPQSPDEDTSFAAGLNTISDHAIATYPNLRYLLFYETDNQILSADPLNRAADLLGVMENMGACGFTVRRVTGEPAGMGASFPTTWQFLIGPKAVHYLGLEANEYDRPEAYTDRDFRYMDIVHTSPLLVKVEAWQDSGGLDAVTFPFSDCDLDWSKTLHDKGWTMAVIPSKDVIHDNQAALSAWSDNRAVQFHQGRYRYLRKHHGNKLNGIWPAGLMARHAMEWLVANVIYIHNRDRRKKIRRTAARLFRLCRYGYDRSKEVN